MQIPIAKLGSFHSLKLWYIVNAGLHSSRQLFIVDARLLTQISKFKIYWWSIVGQRTAALIQAAYFDIAPSRIALFISIPGVSGVRRVN